MENKHTLDTKTLIALRGVIQRFLQLDGYSSTMQELHNQLKVEKDSPRYVRCLVFFMLFPKIFRLTSTEDRSFNRIQLAPHVLVCSDYNSSSGCFPWCESLHLCLRALINLCCESQTCVHSHDLNTTHNQKVLAKFLLDGADQETLWKLLQQTSPQLMPGVCPQYPYNNCKVDKKRCRLLHLCEKYLTGDCQEVCALNHNVIHPQCIRVLVGFGIHPEEGQASIEAKYKRFWMETFVKQKSVRTGNLLDMIETTPEAAPDSLTFSDVQEEENLCVVGEKEKSPDSAVIIHFDPKPAAVIQQEMSKPQLEVSLDTGDVSSSSSSDTEKKPLACLYTDSASIILDQDEMKLDTRSPSRHTGARSKYGDSSPVHKTQDEPQWDDEVKSVVVFAAFERVQEEKIQDCSSFKIWKPAKDEKVCISNLEQMCPNILGTCPDKHCPYPYVWEVYLNDEWIYIGSTCSEEVEKCFRNPSIVVCRINEGDSTMPLLLENLLSIYKHELMMVNFEKLIMCSETSERYPVRRLSTPSRVSVDHKMSTIWEWYFDDHSTWTHFGGRSIQNAGKKADGWRLEEYFLRGDQWASIIVRGMMYRINFTALEQFNAHSKKRKALRRRPAVEQPYD